MADNKNERKAEKTEQKPKNLVSEANSSPKKYEANPVAMPSQDPKVEEAMKQFEKVKAKLEIFKKAAVKKYAFTIAIGLLPANAYQMFEEDEGLPKEVIDSKPLHLLYIVPEDEYKNIQKIKPELIKLIKDTGENIWLHVKTPVDLFGYGLDSKFDMLDAVSASYPIHDNGFLGALRVASIHKTLVLRKFEKYVASYVLGGSLVRGTAGKDSDVDVFVVIDDTDVKRMPRMELLEKLRGIILDYIREATALAGVKNILNVQVYLLTDFWQSVKDAHPVMFTFIRDGIPLWDRGTFIPWKLLLLTGRIKPSPEAVDMYMKQGDQTEEFVKRRLMDTMVDIFWGVTTPTQAMMMLAGEAPPVPKTIVDDVKKVFVEKEKIMTADDLKTLEKTVTLYKDYEHGKLKEISGKEIDQLLHDALEYQKMLKSLRKKIEKKMQQKTAEELSEEMFKILRTLFGEKSEKELMKEFDAKLIKKGKMPPKFSKVIKSVEEHKSKISSGKIESRDFEGFKRDLIELNKALVEYAQRADLIVAEKGAMQILYENRKAELVLLGNQNFIIENNQIRKITDGKFTESTKEEFEKALADNKGKLSTKISGEVFEALKKELGKFEIVF
jgi:predicted nucleotidyltransferase